MLNVVRDAVWNKAQKMFAKTEPGVARRMGEQRMQSARQRFEKFLDSARDDLTVQDALRYAEVVIWSEAGRWVGQHAVARHAQ